MSLQILTIVVALLWSAPVWAEAPVAQTGDHHPTQIIVRYRNSGSVGTAKAGTRHLGRLGVQAMALVAVDRPEEFQQRLQDYKNDPEVLYAEPDYTLKAIATPNDPSFGTLFGLHNTGQSGGVADADIDAPEAWDIHRGNTRLVVAIIDTGVDYKHPDLAANIWTNTKEIPGNSIDDDKNGFIDDIHGYDFANNDGDPFDDNEHGTHVAGTIGAVGNNGVGVVGVNWTARIMAVKFLDAAGSGFTSNAIKCLNYAVANGAVLSNNSWGGGGFSQALSDAITTARNSGHLFMAAAGNDGKNIDTSASYPASYTQDNIISVAATDRNDALASFSNFGATGVDIGAPGVAILSTTPNNTYSTFNGTSMATPHVTGAALLLWSKYPTLSYQEVRNQILNTGDGIAGLVGKTATSRRLNVFNALAPSDAPTGVAAQALSPTEAKVTWADNSTNEATFRIERTETPQDEASWSQVGSVGANVTMFTDTGLQAKVYSYRVRLVRAAGDFAFSPDVATVDMHPPPAPTGLAASQGPIHVILTWTNQAPSASVRIERSKGAGAFSQVGMVGSSISDFTDLQVTPGTSYSYRVLAVDVRGPSPSGAPAAVTTPFPAPPLAALNLKTGISPTEVSLSWTNQAPVGIPTQLGTSGSHNTASPSPTLGPVSLKVERAADGAYSDLVTLPSTATLFKDTGAVPGTKYTYRIVGKDTWGQTVTSAASAEEVIFLPPEIPKGLFAKVTAEKVVLNWTNQTQRPVEIDVERDTGTGVFDVLETLAGSATSYLDTNIVVGSEYSYRLTVKDAYGASSTAPVTVIVPKIGTLIKSNDSWGAGTVSQVAQSTFGLSGPGCTIAQAFHGTPRAKDVRYVRQFRERYLRGNWLGEVVIAAYYGVSPQIAGGMRRWSWLNHLVRGALTPVLDAAKLVALPEKVRPTISGAA